LLSPRLLTALQIEERAELSPQQMTHLYRAQGARATGRPMALTADHDGALVADVVAEWVAGHGSPYCLRLTGVAGGSWIVGEGGPTIERDAIEFCRTVSRREPAVELLAVEIAF
jgi:hypothetical protein